MDISKLGLNPDTVHYNLTYEELAQHELDQNEGQLTDNGTFAVDTGVFTGRSPKDKFVVVEDSSSQNIDWGEVNQRISEETFDHLLQKVQKQLSKSQVYLTDAFAGASEPSRLKVRLLTQYAWQAHFCKNMFIEPTADQLIDFESDFTILNASDLTDPEWQKHGLNSPVFVIFNLKKRLAIIGGTSYAGEMKKGIFSVMNYLLPLRGILSMHCSANIGKDGRSALFFGLSGTGKTTLSADPSRLLIGDDEHGWDDHGLFNIEGGCYAKTIRLNPEEEPEIYKAIRPNALLENVVIDPLTQKVDYDDSTKTENCRVSYPIDHIENAVADGCGPHPSAVIFLTCDAFGVLPPVSRLNHQQAMYHFLSGYTAKVAGTERGIKEPTAAFSPCFGGPFLTLHPSAYAKLLGEKLEAMNIPVYLVNTGWSSGTANDSKRISLPITRRIIDAIHSGELENTHYEKMAYFNIEVPLEIAGVDPKILNPLRTWKNSELYQEKLLSLAEMFIENFKKFDKEEYLPFGPVLEK